MKENKYDDSRFFEQYSQMPRSLNGLEAAGEWHVLQQMLPDFTGKRVLDLGCGFGWHCQYAIDHGALSAVGIDISENMLKRARVMHGSPKIEYICMPVEDYEYPQDSFDVVISSLTLHYIQSFEEICEKVSRTLKAGGTFLFSVEHPIFTAYGNQDWYYSEQGEKLHWPVDGYFMEGARRAVFLGEEVIKYHRTLTTYVNSVMQKGFVINQLNEPQPSDEFIKTIPDMRDELRRPMMLIISAVKL